MIIFADLTTTKVIGEMLEWLKRHAWKACGLPKGLASSNLALSAENGFADTLQSRFQFKIICGDNQPTKRKRDPLYVNGSPCH